MANLVYAWIQYTARQGVDEDRGTPLSRVRSCVAPQHVRLAPRCYAGRGNAGVLSERRTAPPRIVRSGAVSYACLIAIPRAIRDCTGRFRRSTVRRDAVHRGFLGEAPRLPPRPESRSGAHRPVRSPSSEGHDAVYRGSRTVHILRNLPRKPAHASPDRVLLAPGPRRYSASETDDSPAIRLACGGGAATDAIGWCVPRPASNSWAECLPRGKCGYEAPNRRTPRMRRARRCGPGSRAGTGCIGRERRRHVDPWRRRPVCVPQLGSRRVVRAVANART